MDKIPLETLSSTSPNLVMLQVILISFLASLYALAGLLTTRKQTRFVLGIALCFFSVFSKHGAVRKFSRQILFFVHFHLPQRKAKFLSLRFPTHSP